MAPLTQEMRALLSLLANGIIPADERDAGAQSVNAAEEIARKIEQGINTTLYRGGLELARELVREKFSVAPEMLNAKQVDELIGVLRERGAGFYKQLRMDVCAAYLSNPEVWTRIGFPGPSIEKGGYPDFDQPQKRA